MDSRSVSTFLFFACVLLCLDAALSAQSDSQRLANLNALRRSTSSGLLSLTVDNFKAFIENAPRSYGVIVMFSAASNLCKPCGSMSAQLRQVATQYYQLPASKAAARPLFFAELILSMSDQQFLASYNLRHVPILYYFPPGKSRAFPAFLDDKSPDNYPLHRLGIGANAIKEFVNSRTGARMKVIRGNYQIPFVQTVRTFMPAIFAVVGASAAIAIGTGAYKSPMLWFFIVVLVYIFSVGGGHYSWIHNTPLAVVNKEGRMEYIASGSRSQYVAEGFFVSATCVSISVLVILIQELPSVMPNKAGQTVVGMALVFMTILAISALLVMYHFKMPQYLQYSELS